MSRKQYGLKPKERLTPAPQHKRLNVTIIGCVLVEIDHAFANIDDGIMIVHRHTALGNFVMQ